MTTKKAISELRKLVPKEYTICANVFQMDGCNASCYLSVDRSDMQAKFFCGNCLEPCLQEASEWAINYFKEEYFKHEPNNPLTCRKGHTCVIENGVVICPTCGETSPL